MPACCSINRQFVRANHYVVHQSKVGSYVGRVEVFRFGYILLSLDDNRYQDERARERAA